MTVFYLMSMAEPVRTKETGRSVGAKFLDKENFDGLKAIGRDHRGGSIYVVDTSPVYAELALRLLNEGSLYARIIETAHSYPVSVPGHVEIGIAEEFGLGEVTICQKPLAAFVYASGGRYAPERVVQRGLIKRRYALGADGYEALVMRDGKVVMTLQKSEDSLGFNLMVVGDMKSMIRNRQDEETFDLIAGLFAD